jgi:hypothetical protein
MVVSFLGKRAREWSVAGGVRRNCENSFGEKVDKFDWRDREDTDITTCVNKNKLEKERERACMYA